MKPSENYAEKADCPFGFCRIAMGVALGSAALAASGPVVAEEAEPATAAPTVVEEVVVVGRLLSAAAQLTDERIQDESFANLLSSDDIGRVGDSTVSAALRRIAGLTVVGEQFVYVRGLGERYSSTLLNGARVPSVDLSRNVIPLNIFPTTIVESLKVEKSYTADQLAAFGGGAIDIRTKGQPDGLVYGLEIGSAINSENDDEYFTYDGGSDDSFGQDDGSRALPEVIREEILNYRGDIGVQSILTTERGRGNPAFTLAEAQALNRDIATRLNRDFSVREDDVPFDRDLRAYFGNSAYLTNDLEVGFLVAGAYESDIREVTRVNRNFRFPEERTDTEVESQQSVNITANANGGIRWTDEQEVSATLLYLRNTDDETGIRTFFNENREVSDGIGFENTRFRYEEREIEVAQFRGRHQFGAATRTLLDEWTGGILGLEALDIIPEEIEFRWFYSDSEARTDIPNETEIARQGSTDPVTGASIDMSVILSPNAVDYRFTTLDEEVQDGGWAVNLPVYLDDWFIEVEGGYRHTRQARSYEQLQFALGPTFVPDLDTLSLPLGDVFSDAAITNPDNDYSLSRTGANNQSYIAATMTDAWYAKADITWMDTWRLNVGVRWEDYKQVAVDFDPFGLSAATPIVTTDPIALQNAAFADADYYPAVSLTYMSDFLAETFQLRFAYSETVTRPDLREITDASYIDPITNTIVNGNPGTQPSLFENFDVRAEWYFSNGDQASITAFYKDIENPIEFFESPASDTNTAREIVNAESAEIYGVELEVLKELGFIHDWLQPFFFQMNLTLQDSELVAGDQADAPTNDRRELVNAAPYIVNAQLGFDSDNGQHSATVAYNVFDERLFVAGRNGAPDGFEQPFHSIDMTYFWYPTDRITVRAKLQNLLDDDIEVQRQGVTVFEQKIGRTIAASVRYDF